MIPLVKTNSVMSLTNSEWFFSYLLSIPKTSDKKTRQLSEQKVVAIYQFPEQQGKIVNSIKEYVLYQLYYHSLWSKGLQVSTDWQWKKSQLVKDQLHLFLKRSHKTSSWKMDHFNPPFLKPINCFLVITAYF